MLAPSTQSARTPMKQDLHDRELSSGNRRAIFDNEGTGREDKALSYRIQHDQESAAGALSRQPAQEGIASAIARTVLAKASLI
jgi:hypothetical protein